MIKQKLQDTDQEPVVKYFNWIIELANSVPYSKLSCSYSNPGKKLLSALDNKL